MEDRVNLPRRKSPRLAGYDYAQASSYLVTIGVDFMEQRFGDVKGGAMEPSQAGQMIAAKWISIPKRFLGVELDEFVVMPNHFHGIIHVGTDPESNPPSLSSVVQAFKSESAMEYSRGVHAGFYPRYKRALWQRSFHDKILPNEFALIEARAYVLDNPRKWQEGHRKQCR